MAAIDVSSRERVTEVPRTIARNSRATRPGSEGCVDPRADDQRRRLTRDALDRLGVAAAHVQIELANSESTGPRGDLVAEREPAAGVDLVAAPDAACLEGWPEGFGEGRSKKHEEIRDGPVVARGQDRAQCFGR